MSHLKLSPRRTSVLVAALFALAALAIVLPGSRVNHTAAASPLRPAAGGSPFSADLRAQAVTSGSSVLLVWDVAPRPNVLGYNVYRESRGRFTLVTPTPVAGRTLQFSAPGVAPASERYAWWDQPGVGMGGVRYWVDEITLANEASRFGPFTPGSNRTDKLTFENSKTLGDLNAAKNDAGVSTELSRATVPAAGARDTLTMSKASGKPDADALATALDQQWAIAGGAALKIAVDRDGWQKIPFADMQAAGLTVSNPASYRLFADGIEQSIRANSDGSLEFYGRGLDTDSTDTHIYWLVAGSRGARVQQVNTGPFDGAVPAASYTATVVRRDRIVRFSSLINGPGNNWFGPVIVTTPVKQTLPVTDLDPAGPVGLLEVQVQGLTTVSHFVDVRLNGALMGTITFNSLDLGYASFPVPMSLLQNGKNLVTVVSTGPSGDISLCDYERLSYTRHQRASNDHLRLNVPANQAIRVDGFSSPQIRVFDLTDPQNPAELLVGTAADGNGGFAFTLPAAPARSILAETAAAAESYFAQLSANVPSNLNAASNQADFIILAPTGWTASAEPLRALRQSQGLNTRIVDIGSAYDEFSYGAHDPQAIHDFLQRAKTTWSTPPRYVLLLGDATQDPRNYLGPNGPSADPMPTMFVNAQYSEGASDDSLTDFDGDGIADISTGRLPAKNVTQANLMIAKVLQHETMPAGDTMTRGALMVSDTFDGYDFQSFTNEVRTFMPGTLPVQFISRDDGDSTTVHNNIVASIDSGKAIVNFLGHGNITNWTGAGILTVSDPPSFSNQNHYSLFVMLTCLNGSFIDTNSECLAEEMMRSQNGGAVAVWASAGLTFPDGQVAISERFYTNIFAVNSMRIGDAVRDAKTQTQDPDIRHLAILFADPTMKMQ